MKATKSTDETARALREHGFRATSQRLLIDRALRDFGRHATAEEVLAAARGRLPGISLPTVYSALEVLEEAGLVLRIAAGRGPALYDAGADHHHLVCRRCGAVADLEVEAGLAPLLQGARDSGFGAEHAEVVVHGLCAGCASR